MSNNIWTFGQQHYVFGKIEKEEEAKKEEALARRAANAPAPGVKPTKPKKGAPAATNGATGEAGDEAVAEAEPETESGPAKPAAGGTTARTPRPGARPKKRKR